MVLCAKLFYMSHMVKTSDGYEVKVPSKGATDYAVVG